MEVIAEGLEVARRERRRDFQCASVASGKS
jgi:hypothetical protein